MFNLNLYGNYKGALGVLAGIFTVGVGVYVYKNHRHRLNGFWQKKIEGPDDKKED